MEEFFKIMVVIVIVIGGPIALCSTCRDTGYREGQTDALRGTWKYERVIKPDGGEEFVEFGFAHVAAGDGGGVAAKGEGRDE